MRAIMAERFGGPRVLAAVDRPEPVAGPGQLVIDVKVADVLFLDTQLRAGWGQEFFGIIPPFVPGDGVAGRAAAVGDGVSPRWLGRRVVARTGGGGGYAGGGYAERAAVREEYVAEVPDGLDLTDAAALLHDGPTAIGLAESTGVGQGEWVLVVGAAGGMGTLLVQLANGAGARVVGAARGREKLDLVRSLGAAVVVDYADPDWLHLVRQAAGVDGVAAVFDGVGGEAGTAAFAALAPGGRFSAHGAPSGDFAAINPDVAAARGVTVRGIEQTQFAPAAWRRLAERAMAEAVAGRLRPSIGQIYSLAHATDAHTAIEARAALGKTLLAVD